MKVFVKCDNIYKIEYLLNNKVVEVTGKDGGLYNLPSELLEFSFAAINAEYCEKITDPTNLKYVQAGNIVINNDGDARKVFARVEDVVLLSASINHSLVLGDWYSIEELKEWKIKTDEPKQTVKEVTMKDVCDKFGHEVKIKKEDE